MNVSEEAQLLPSATMFSLETPKSKAREEANERIVTPVSLVFGTQGNEFTT